jgi:hypothetical protein
MNCDQCEENLADYILGRLSVETDLAVHRHLASGCLQCNTALHELEIASTALSVDLPPVKPPARVLDQVLATIRAEPSGSPDALIRAAKPRTVSAMDHSVESRLLLEKLWIAVAASLLAGLFSYWITRQMDEQSFIDHAVSSNAATQRIEERLKRTSSGVRVVSLDKTDPDETLSSQKLHQFVAFDSLAKQMHVGIYLPSKRLSDGPWFCYVVGLDGQEIVVGELRASDPSTLTGVFDLSLVAIDFDKVIVRHPTATERAPLSSFQIEVQPPYRLETKALTKP